MVIRFNPEEYIEDLLATGYSKPIAILMAKDKIADRRKSAISQLKADNDYRNGKGAQHVRVQSHSR